MIIMKKALDRRMVLRGLGAAISLPLLDAMVPALEAASRTAARAPMRLGFFYVPNGMFLPNYHPKGDGGTEFEVTPILSPLAPLRDYLVIVSGLSNKAAENLNEGGGPHTRSHAAWLSGVRPKRTEGADITAAKTIDQYAADKLGADTQVRSLELTTESSFIVGNCENGYSCAYLNSTSWRTPTQPNPHEQNPRVVFEQLFGDAGSVSARLAQMRRDRSILDSVNEDIERLKRRIGAEDTLIVDEYLDAVREVERRIERAEQHNSETAFLNLTQPVGIPVKYDEHVRLLMDLQFLAYQADITRVSTLQIARESSGRTYPELGVPEGHHTVSHHQTDPHLVGQNTKINIYHMSLVADLAKKMRDTPDGEGSLLDHTILMHGSGMGDGDLHTPVNLAVTLVGGGCGQLRGGRHLKYAMDTPAMNLGLALLDKVGVELESLGDSTGRVAGL
jgi:hypothetical protein